MCSQRALLTEHKNNPQTRSQNVFPLTVYSCLSKNISGGLCVSFRATHDDDDDQLFQFSALDDSKRIFSRLYPECGCPAIGNIQFGFSWTHCSLDRAHPTSTRNEVPGIRTFKLLIIICMCLLLCVCSLALYATWRVINLFAVTDSLLTFAWMCLWFIQCSHRLLPVAFTHLCTCIFS